MKKPVNLPWRLYIKHGLIKHSRFFVNVFFESILLTMPVWQDIKRFKQEIKKHEQFRGKYRLYAKFYIIYKTVRQLKPQYVLECGCGISTIIIARALKDNGHGTFVSMEQYGSFGDVIAKMAGSAVQLHISDTEETAYGSIQGTRYKHIPDYPYDFIFVDGPKTNNADLDAFYVLERQPKAKVLVDCRVRTIAALQTKYPGVYNQFTNMGYINFKN